MSMSVVVEGRVGADAETKNVGGGSVVEVRVACNIGRRDDESTTWVRVSIWGRYGEALRPHLLKGVKVVVQAQVTKLNAFDGRNGPQVGMDVKAHQISIMSDRTENKSQGNSANSWGDGNSQSYTGGGGGW